MKSSWFDRIIFKQALSLARTYTMKLLESLSIVFFLLYLCYFYSVVCIVVTPKQYSKDEEVLKKIKYTFG